MNKGVVYTLWDYEAQSADELSFQEGDAITILRRKDETETEWWWAKLNDKEGYVARNLLGVKYNTTLLTDCMKIPRLNTALFLLLISTNFPTCADYRFLVVALWECELDVLRVSNAFVYCKCGLQIRRLRFPLCVSLQLYPRIKPRQRSLA